MEKITEQLKQTILSNPEGFTADKNGMALKLNKGYAVSITNNKNKDIDSLINEALRLAHDKKRKNYYFGGWYDKQNKEFYLDITLIKHNLNTAYYKIPNF